MENKLLEKLKEELSIDELKEMSRDVNGYDGRLDFLDYYENDEYFFRDFFGDKVDEAVRATYYGDYNYMDDYVKFNAYGNLDSCSEYEYEKEMYKKASSKNLLELLDIANKKYKYNITKSQLMQYLSKRNIKYKNFNNKMIRNMGDKIPIGTEYTKSDGMVLVKISKNKWEYKQRLLYQKYHNVKLTTNDFIIFLDQDRKNFSKENLGRISRKEAGYMANQKIFSKNAEITKTGILATKFWYKIKDKEKKLSEVK